MQFSGIGTIHIRSGSSSGSIVTSFTCGVSTEAVIVNNVLTINPKDDLATGTVFYVTLPSAGIANTVGSFIDPITSYNFNEDISKWNVSNVTDMSHMFEGANQFNQSINKWNVSNVINMSGMFDHAL